MVTFFHSNAYLHIPIHSNSRKYLRASHGPTSLYNDCQRSEADCPDKDRRAEGGFSGHSKVQGPVSNPNSVDCYGQLNGSSLHKQTRRNPLGDVRSPVEDHDLVPSLPDNLKSQTHSSISECDG